MSANDPVWEVVQGASRSQGWLPWQAAQRSNTPKQDVPEGFAPERALAALRSLPAPFLGQTHLAAIHEMSSALISFLTPLRLRRNHTLLDPAGRRRIAGLVRQEQCQEATQQVNRFKEKTYLICMLKNNNYVSDNNGYADRCTSPIKATACLINGRL
ncbi:hypothetical protein [Herbaspirillum sp. NPDC101397]|uniref:hypothetical protein n=1 Tax=Herbaspirillum sp. NPDC101397 TaxID=3364006 RepID=UPI00383BE51C